MPIAVVMGVRHDGAAEGVFESMPTYVYACVACGERLEAVQRITDDPLSICPACSGALRKVIQPVGVVFKGSGFYKTDSRGSSSATAPAKQTEAGSGSGSDSDGKAASNAGSGTSESGSSDASSSSTSSPSAGKSPAKSPSSTSSSTSGQTGPKVA